MPWSSRSKNFGEERERDEAPEWIHSTSIAEATSRVRDSLKKHGLHATDQDWVIVQLAHVAITRGLTRQTARLIVRLMERRNADGKLTWHLSGPRIGAIGISIVRLMAAYLEDPEIPVSRARNAIELFLRSIATFDDLKTVRQLLPYIAAVRLDAAPAGSPAKSSRLPMRADMATSGMCSAAHRQWRVEYLLAMGDEEAALDLAHRGRSEKPCGSICDFAPHSMYAWLLEPLHRRGRRDEARVLHDRLETLLTPRALHLDAMGCRIHYLTLENRFADAGALLRTMHPIAREEDASPWQRRKFYESCVQALDRATHPDHLRALLPPDTDSATLREELSQLRTMFANRGG